MSRFLQLALAGQDIPVYGDGSQTRTFCYIDDNLDACVKAMESDLLVNDVANIGNGTIVTILELAETIIRLTERNGTVEMDFELKGMKGVPVTIELCFKEGGQT